MVRTRKTQIYPLQLTVNFWEIRPSQMAERLDRLSKQGIKHLTAFVPWQLAESDIQHSLTRFLKEVLERDLSVSLVLTPELGVKFPYAGVPKDLATNESVFALDTQGDPFICALPPVWFALPSFNDPQVWSRYTKFLQKCEGWILDFFREDPSAKKRIQVVLTGGFFRYYRSYAEVCGFDKISTCGDESKAGLKAFAPYTKKSLQSPEGKLELRKESDLSEYQENLRRAYFWEAEREFRAKQQACFKRLGQDLDLIHLDLLTPEADSALLAATTFSELNASFDSSRALNNRLSRELRVIRSDGKKEIAPAIHWSSLGLFSKMNESVRQFFLWKTLLNTGSRKGALFLSEAEFNRLQPSFRKKLCFFADLALEGELRVDPEVAMVSYEGSSHARLNSNRSLFPNCGEADLLQITDFSLLRRMTDLKCVLVDDRVVIDSVSLSKLIDFSRRGGTVALSKSARFTELARLEWKEFYDFKKSFETPLIGGGLEIYQVEKGKFIHFESSGEVDSKTYQAIFSLAEVSSRFEITQNRCEILSLKKKEGSDRALFLMNSDSKTTEPMIKFDGEKGVCDFLETYRNKENTHPVSLKECRVEIPAYGILSLHVSGFGEDERERKIAEAHSKLTSRYAEESALAILPGYQDGGL